MDDCSTDGSFEYIKELASGTIDASKFILRNTDTGHIIKHGDILFDKDSRKEIVKGAKSLGIIGLAIGGTVLVGFGVYKVVNHFKEKEKIKMPKEIRAFHGNLDKYIKEAHKGIINVKTVDKLLKSIDIIEQKNDPNIKIDFSTNEVKELLNLIYSFTIKLNENDRNHQKEFRVPSDDSENNVICFKDYLNYQKELAKVG